MILIFTMDFFKLEVKHMIAQKWYIIALLYYDIPKSI